MSDTEYQELPSELLTDWPLYSKYVWSVERSYHRLRPPAIHMYCRQCRVDRTFSPARMNSTADASGDASGQLIALWYTCAFCKASKHGFLIRVSEDRGHLSKVGQFPPPDLAIGNHLSRALGDYEEIYKKGLACERFGYGIGAYAYYRRIVELMLDRLLTIIKDLIPNDDKAALDAAFARVSSSHVAEDKLRLIKDLLPASLRPDGVNPLAVIYDALSEGLHSGSDEECLLWATQTRSALTYLIEKVEADKQVTQTFTSAMRGLLERKAPRST